MHGIENGSSWRVKVYDPLVMGWTANVNGGAEGQQPLVGVLQKPLKPQFDLMVKAMLASTYGLP